MTVSLTPSPLQKFFDVNGVPLAGGQLYTYASGTSTPQATYTDSTGLIANTNPIILDSLGQANIWLVQGQVYRYLLEDVNSVQQPDYPVDGINSGMDALQSIASSTGATLIGDQLNMPNTLATNLHTELSAYVSIFNWMTTSQITGIQANVTVGNDVTIAVQNAFDSIAASGGTLYIPDGTYNLSASITNSLLPTSAINIKVVCGASTVFNYLTSGGYINCLFYLRYFNLSRFEWFGGRFECNLYAACGLWTGDMTGSSASPYLVRFDGLVINNPFAGPGFDCRALNIYVNTSPNPGQIAIINACSVFNLNRTTSGNATQAVSIVGFRVARVTGNVVNGVHTPNNTSDADGIVVFDRQTPVTSTYTRGTTEISNNHVVDCEGRFIKLQTNGITEVHCNHLEIINPLILIPNFIGIDSQVMNADIHDNQFFFCYNFTGGIDATCCALQGPQISEVTNGLSQSWAHSTQRFYNNHIFCDSSLTGGPRLLAMVGVVPHGAYTGTSRHVIYGNTIGFPDNPINDNAYATSCASTYLVYFSPQIVKSPWTNPAGQYSGKYFIEVDKNEFYTRDVIYFNSPGGSADDWTNIAHFYVRDNVKLPCSTPEPQVPIFATLVSAPQTYSFHIHGNQIGPEGTSGTYMQWPLDMSLVLDDNEFVVGSQNIIHGPSNPIGGQAYPNATFTRHGGYYMCFWPQASGPIWDYTYSSSRPSNTWTVLSN